MYLPLIFRVIMSITTAGVLLLLARQIYSPPSEGNTLLIVTSLVVIGRWLMLNSVDVVVMSTRAMLRTAVSFSSFFTQDIVGGGFPVDSHVIRTSCPSDGLGGVIFSSFIGGSVKQVWEN